MDERTRWLKDPREMRALAHPLRLRLLGLLRVEGPATASMLAERVGEVPALASYHLRQLASHGFVEEAPELARNGRERWWRAAHERTSWEAREFLDTPERIAALNALQRELFARYRDQLEEYLMQEPAWGPEWVEAADHSDYQLRLDAAGLRALARDLETVVERYQRRPPAAKGPREHVTVIVHAFPRAGR